VAPIYIPPPLFLISAQLRHDCRPVIGTTCHSPARGPQTTKSAEGGIGENWQAPNGSSRTRRKDSMIDQRGFIRSRTIVYLDVPDPRQARLVECPAQMN